MPDLMVVPFWQCQTAEEFEVEVVGSKGEKYTVSFGHTFHRGVEFDWSCTCPAFKFGRGKPCKHILAVQARTVAQGGRCGWSEFEDGGEVARDAAGRPVCPKCGKPAESRMWGV